MHAIITTTGKDRPGVIAAVSAEAARQGLNIVDVSQTIMDDYFTMIMRVELPEGEVDMGALQEAFDAAGEPLGMVVRIQSDALFSAINDI
ncbi:ACT domain-containing protein [Corynebacterium ureicelerivorans]|uniref:ACT domain-containing protein n=1 Tax=Corynebacterium ureicelerivorans TaxID=401472 RepID=UPI00264C324B|nr:ACT domain-containing protein [Corynebacterium ureicelerivorans]MDN8605752.1 ACT domain-containing protein [Corynebacterium ureicelerivorans]